MGKTATKTQAAAKAKGKTGTAAPVEAERGPNRYLRAARVIIEFGTGGEPNTVDIAELASRAGMSPATANHCWSAFTGICAALREAKMLPARKAPAKRLPEAPSAPENAEEPEPVPA